MSDSSRIRRWIDGEMTDGEVAKLHADAARDPVLGAEMRRTEDLRRGLLTLGSPLPPPGIVDRIVSAAVRQQAQAQARLAPRPRPWAVKLLPHFASGLAGAAIALAIVRAVAPGGPQRRAPVQPRAERTLRLHFSAPGARTVSIAGDWNGWSPSRQPLRDLDGDGVFSAELRVPAGTHRYMYVVDGSRWVTDPAADRRRPDDFGNEDSILDLN